MTPRAEHVSKSFGTNTLFRDLDLLLDQPTVLWAASGWGKTTLLRLFMGLEKPDTGRVADVGRVSAVFQEDRLCPQLNAVQNVLLVLPDAAQRDAIEQDFAYLGMAGEALRLPAARLSGGQKRRCALLRALWAPADTLLLDEPFTGMDPDTMQRAVQLVQTRRGTRAVLLASHDREAIRLLGWRVVTLGNL